jgi:S-methylmethionine-dependent homocysteine/selenocysteine methylase
MSIVILDGGTGRELQRLGAPFRQPEWSALSLMEAPEYVYQCHENYIRAGADVITTNSYAIVPFHIGEEGFKRQGAELVTLAGQLAHDAKTHASRSVQVAGSIPPVMGSYRPDLFDESSARHLLEVLMRGLNPWIDLWLAETLSSSLEAKLFLTQLGSDPKPRWISFTLDDNRDKSDPRLRSGETIAAALKNIEPFAFDALLFNCSQPETMLAAISTLKSMGFAKRIGVYANAFPAQNGEEAANEHLHDIRTDLTPSTYASFANQWIQAGATIIGGCCGIGPEHIHTCAQTLRDY